MTDAPSHGLVDFVGLANQLTNEQKILNALLRIEALLAAAPTPPVVVSAPELLKGKPVAASTLLRRK